jgi:hypothetical protein
MMFLDFPHHPALLASNHPSSLFLILCSTICDGRKTMRDYLPFLFSFFFISILYILLYKDCIHCNAHTNDEEWVAVVQYVRLTFLTATQYGGNIHKSFMIRNVCLHANKDTFGE